MRDMARRLDTASIVTLVITLVLFVFAVFTKGWTHDLLLEAGVFLVSVKLMLLAYHSSKSSDEIKQRLDDIAARLGQRSDRP